MKKTILCFISIFFLAYCQAQKASDDRLKILRAMDSLGIRLNQPLTPIGFTAYRNCDSIPFFKKISGDTITILKKGGWANLLFNDEPEFSSFMHFATHHDTENGSYFSNGTDGHGLNTINIQHNTRWTFVFQHDSLFEYYFDDSEYNGLAFGYAMENAFGGLDSLEMVKKTEAARKKYPGVIRKDFMFTKKMFDKTSVVNINKKLHHGTPRITLLRKWEKNGLNCYHIEVAQPTEIGYSKFEYIFDEKMNFVEWENCDKQ